MRPVSVIGIKKYGIIALLCAGFLCGCTKQLTLTIAHINDTHAHLDPVPVTVLLDGMETRVCAGGFSRMATKLQRLRKTEENLLFLHAGDELQGTLYGAYYRGKANAALLNEMGVDALCVGNHEFDYGPGVLASFIRAADFPVLSANIDVSGESLLKGSIDRWSVKTIDGVPVGIIGLTTESTPDMSNPGDGVVFNNAAESLRRAVSALERRGVGIIIALTHLGYEQDRRIAGSVGGVDIIVGGHSHSLLGDAIQYGRVAAGPYPTVVCGPRGDDVLIVQAWQWGLMLGVLRVTFDSTGRLVSAEGGPVMLIDKPFEQKNLDGAYVPVDKETERRLRTFVEQAPLVEIVPEDSSVRRKLQPYAAAVEDAYRTIVARTAERLDYERVPERVKEPSEPPAACLASHVTDAMLWKLQAAGLPAEAALVNAGGIRSGIPAGPVSAGNVFEVLPFQNRLIMIGIQAGDLRHVLERAVSRALCNNSGAFPYVAGLRYSVDTGSPRKDRIVRLERCPSRAGCIPLGDHEWINLVINSYMLRGGNGYGGLAVRSGYIYDSGLIDTEAFGEYLQMKETVACPSECREVLYE